MPDAPGPVSERAARAALAAFFTPDQLAADRTRYDPATLWQRLVRADRTGRLAAYDPENRLETAQRTGAMWAAQFVIPGDADWPAAADALDTLAPLGIWVRGPGGLGALSARAIAVVGNRAASPWAADRAADIAAGLADAGYTVTASLAYGIDSAAHTGAQRGSAPSLAVLPCGLDHFHPYTHDRLRAAIEASGGAAISAFPPGTPVTQRTLRACAQLIAAVSTAVVAVEALPRSPALDAAARAHYLGRPVLAVPPLGPVGKRYAAGSLEWLHHERARPVESAADVLAALAASPAAEPGS